MGTYFGNFCIIFLFIFHTDTCWADRFALHGIERLACDSFLTILYRSYICQKHLKRDRMRNKKRNTYPAHETIRMPLTIQGRDIVFHYGTIASTAFGGKHIEVIVATIGLAITLVESLLAELLTALGTEEMLCMPSFLEGCHAFLQKRIEMHEGEGA